MIQYIASDVDGTLLHGHATTLNPELFDIIRQLKEHGIHFIAASGRQYKNLQRLFAPVKDDISYVAENGSMCVHPWHTIRGPSWRRSRTPPPWSSWKR